MGIFAKKFISENAVGEIVRDLQLGCNIERNFRFLFDHYNAGVVRMFARNGFCNEDSHDLAQEVFLAAYRSIGDLRDVSQFPSWLVCIARNALLNEIERRKAKKRFFLRAKERPKEGLGDQSQNDTTIEHLADRSYSADTLGQILDRERLGAVMAVTRELPPQMRRCVHLRIVEDQSYNEIAIAMGLSINTVKAHLHQAKKILREKLLPYFPDLEV
jgi:RNA polymerase sigma-70 factor (ECF subfamily)